MDARASEPVSNDAERPGAVRATAEANLLAIWTSASAIPIRASNTTDARAGLRVMLLLGMDADALLGGNKGLTLPRVPWAPELPATAASGTDSSRAAATADTDWLGNASTWPWYQWSGDSAAAWGPALCCQPIKRHNAAAASAAGCVDTEGHHGSTHEACSTSGGMRPQSDHINNCSGRACLPKTASQSSGSAGCMTVCCLLLGTAP